MATVGGDEFKFYVDDAMEVAEYGGWTYARTDWGCVPPWVEINEMLCRFIDDGHNTTRMVPHSRGSGRCPTGSRPVLSTEVTSLWTGAAIAFPGTVGCRVGLGPGACLRSGSRAVVWAAMSGVGEGPDPAHAPRAWLQLLQHRGV